MSINSTFKNRIKKNNQETKDRMVALKSHLIGIKVKKSESGRSKEVHDEDKKVTILGQKVIEPPFDLLTLAMIPENNTELIPCIEAMQINIDGFGHRLVPRLKGKNIPENIKREIELERIKLENFFYNVTSESFVKFRGKLRKDVESTGNYYFEIIRSLDDEIQGFNHIPSYKMRLGKMQEEAVLTNRLIHEIQLDGSIKVVQRKELRKFRTYIQVSSTSKNIRWYKEFGDNRTYNCETGELADDDLDDSKKASEIIHYSLYCPRSPYGLPRYIGNLLSILGDRASEEINFVTFKNNNIPSMMILVSNGQLTEDSLVRLKEFSESNIQSSDNYSKFIVIEAETLEEEGEDGGQIKVDAKPLTGEQHTDALFQNYSKNNKDAVRRSFRLPPIFIGNSVDYNRGTADTSRKLADEQIFDPERREFDSLINRVIFPYLGAVYHTYKSNSPQTTDNEQLVKILAGAEKTGGMTPRIARNLLEDILGIELPDFPEGFDPDVPFSLTMAEAVKNKADATEPGQQVTAIKVFKTLLKEATGIEEHPLIKHIEDIQEELESKWSDDMEENHDHKEE